VQLGIRQARYIGRTKTLFQLLLTAAVANLTLLANAATEGSDGAFIAGACIALAAVLLARQGRPDGPEAPNPDPRWPVPGRARSALSPAWTWPSTFRTPASRPGF